MHKLTIPTTQPLRSLFGDLLNYHVTIDAVLEGKNPGTVFVDNPAEPKVILLIGPEGTYLGGKSPTEAQITDVKTQLSALLQKHELEAIWLDCTPDWKNHLNAIHPWEPIPLERQRYTCTALTLNWKQRVPAGFSIKSLSESLLATPSLDIPEHIHDWIEGNWGSKAIFFERGFGAVAIDEAKNSIVSWSLCDCIGGNTCEIGIHTRPEYRRRGLAAITAAAAVDDAFKRKFDSVGWHCNSENIASRHTATSIGFLWQRDYTHMLCINSEAVHWAEAGRIEETHGNYEKAAAFYVRATSAADQPEWHTQIPFLAACAFAQNHQNSEAWEWLNKAIDGGFNDVERLKNNEALTSLRHAPEWDVLLKRLEVSS